jgi:hypothetical protein
VLLEKGTASAVPLRATKQEALALRDCKELTMSANSKKSMGWTVVLILLGMGALYGGSKWLTLLIPAALFVWYVAKPRLRTGRN